MVPIRSTIIQDVKGMHAAGLATLAYYYFDFGMPRSKTAMASSPPLSFSFLPNRILVSAFSPGYIPTMVMA